MEQFMNMLVVAMLSMSPAKATKPMVQIENWPPLKVTEHLVASMPDACSANGAGCAVVNFNDRTCDIYVAWGEPLKAAIRERELKRCRGYDEPPYRLRLAYAQWLATQPCKPRKEGDVRPMAAAAVD